MAKLRDLAPAASSPPNPALSAGDNSAAARVAAPTPGLEVLSASGSHVLVAESLRVHVHWQRALGGALCAAAEPAIRASLLGGGRGGLLAPDPRPDTASASASLVAAHF